MNQSTTDISRIGGLLTITIAITILYSYLPADLTLVRSTLSLVQLGFMALIMVLAFRVVLRDF